MTMLEPTWQALSIRGFRAESHFTLRHQINQSHDEQEAKQCGCGKVAKLWLLIKNTPTTCAACLQVATGLVEFSGPMELPLSRMASAVDAEMKDPVTVRLMYISNWYPLTLSQNDSQSPGPIQPITSIDLDAFKVPGGEL
jgi:hypothetical protein